MRTASWSHVLRLDRTFVTFRLNQEDREKLRTIARGRESRRHDALLKLAPIVKRLKLPKVRRRKRRAIRIGIPSQLDHEIRRVMKRTGRTYLDILLAAVHEYTREEP